MILLDSDHVTVLRMPASERRTRLVTRLATTTEAIGIPVVVVEETMRGWMAALAKERQAARQVMAYRELASLFAFFAGFTIAPFEDVAVAFFDTFSRIRIGAGDRKIAATALATNALLLTANRRDFELIPGLRFDNWLD